MKEPKKFIRCKRCNRILKTEEAQIRGYGKYCYLKYLEQISAEKKHQINIFNVKNMEKVNE